jgi:hypothetical protein
MGTHRSGPRAIAVEFEETITVRFLVESTEPNGTTRSMHVYVCFPDEARAVLETMSWTNPRCILDVLFDIGGAYAGTSVMTHYASETDGVSDDRVGHAPMVLNLPLGFFRARLELPSSS